MQSNTATLSTDSLNAQYEDRIIPLELIDAPDLPERQTMDEQALGELALNIREVGLIKPLIVKPVKARYQVVAGHRRWIACDIAEYRMVPCRVIVKGLVDPLSILIAENYHVETPNCVEEAEFYQRVLAERCGNDVDALVIVVGRRREYLEDRLNLLRGWPRVIDALKQKMISIAVARELNKMQHEGRMLQLLDVSIAQGATARQVSEWRRQYEQMGSFGLPDEGTEVQQDQPSAPVEAYQMKCWFCDGTDDPHLMEMKWIHKHCDKSAQLMLWGPKPQAS